MNSRTPQFAALAALALVVAGCSHAPARPAAVEAEPPVEWPAPPSAPRVRLERVVSVALPGSLHRSWWRTVLSFLIGSTEEESGDAAFARPFGVALEPAGTLVVSDPDAPAVLRYGEGGTFQEELACPDAPWAAPMAVAVGPGEAIVVADGGRGSIVRWTRNGCAEMGAKLLSRPVGLALSSDRIFVADPPAHQIVVFAADGTLVGRYGSLGSGDGQFNFPTGVALAPDGTLWVVDALNFRLAHLAADGTWLGAFGAPGESGPGLARPKGIHVDAVGRIYVTDAQRDQILVFTPDGALDYVIGAPGGERGRFAHPAGIDVEKTRLVVADSQNRRVQLFEILGERT